MTLLDCKHGLVDRLRFARRRSNDVNWWRSQLNSTSPVDYQKCFLVLVAFWSSASRPTTLDLFPELSKFIDGLSECDWQHFLEFAPEILSSDESLRMKDAATFLPEFTSLRLALLVGTKWPGAFGTHIFRRHFLNETEASAKNKAVAEFRQAQAFRAALAGTLDWKTSLKIIRSVYLRQDCSNLGQLYFFHASTKLPYPVAQQILQHIDDYPVYLWNLAERAMELQFRQNVQPVGKVAKKDRWFH